jgi:uncharacterized protein
MVRVTAPFGLALIATYLGGVVLFPVLLGYPLALGLQAAGWDAIPFHRLVFRLMKLAAVVGVWPLLIALDLRGRAAWGLGRGEVDRGPGRGLLLGLGVGVASLGLVVAALLALGVRVFAPPSDPALASLLLRAALTAVVVAAVEEIWLRGGLQSACRRLFGPVAAVLGIAAFYGLIHFLRPDLPVSLDEAGWSGGLRVLGGSFGRLADPGILDSLFALVAAGVLLGLVRERTGRVAECIGLHAGWVFVIGLSRRLTETVPDAGQGWVAGRYDGVIGVLAGAVFLALAWGWRPGPRRRR